jgi:ABC-type transporter lipoprotein component MlaA
VVLLLCLPPFAHGQQPAVESSSPSSVQTVVLPKSVPDPIEPVNRARWAFNRELMTGLIKPTSRVYRFIVVKPVRTGIGNFGRNLTYPGRLINNLLQGKWTGARDETCRFFCNSTVGWPVGLETELLPNAADPWTEQRTGHRWLGRRNVG